MAQIAMTDTQNSQKVTSDYVVVLSHIRDKFITVM